MSRSISVSSQKSEVGKASSGWPSKIFTPISRQSSNVACWEPSTHQSPISHGMSQFLGESSPECPYFTASRACGERLLALVGSSSFENPWLVDVWNVSTHNEIRYDKVFIPMFVVFVFKMLFGESKLQWKLEVWSISVLPLALLRLRWTNPIA